MNELNKEVDKRKNSKRIHDPYDVSRLEVTNIGG